MTSRYPDLEDVQDRAKANGYGPNPYERNETNETMPAGGYERNETNETMPAGGYERNETNERTSAPAGLLSLNSFLSYAEAPWPELSDAALYGPIGDAVRLLEPHSEADQAAVLATLLTGFGAIVGSSPHVIAGHARHPARLGVVIVGKTAKARKGTSWATARLILDELDEYFVTERVLGGFGSGEAVVDEVRDGGEEDDDRSVVDKRLLIHEGEFARVLKVCAREASVLSTIMRDAWDGSRLQTRSRARKAVATGHHVTVVGHITADELTRNLTETEIAAGFANRLLWFCAKRSKRLPFGGSPDPAALNAVIDRLRSAVAASRKVSELGFTEAARPRWVELYEQLADDDPDGMLGAVIARAEAQALRLAVTFALADGADTIDVAHIDAAHAVWQYSRASARHIWGDTIGDAIADRLYRAVAKAGSEGLTLTDQSAVFGRNVKQDRLDQARTVLQDRQLIETVTIPSPSGKGRPRVVSRVVSSNHEGQDV